MYNIYVLRRILFGLGDIHINGTHMAALARAQLRDIQGLPTCTNIPALHILSKVQPIQVMVEKKRISSLPSISRHPTIHNIYNRQLAMKYSKPHSWVIHSQNPTSMISRRRTCPRTHRKTPHLMPLKDKIEEIAEEMSSRQFLRLQFRPTALHFHLFDYCFHVDVSRTHVIDS